MGCFGYKTVEVSPELTVKDDGALNKNEEEKKIPEIKELDDEPIIKKESDLKENIESEKDKTERKDNSEEKNDIIDINKFKKCLTMHFGKEDLVYNVVGLTNDRIAIVYYDEKDIKIYSLITGKCDIEIDKKDIRKVIELKNNDIVLCSYSIIYIYKLLQNKNYELYQTIEGLKSVVELKNDNLVGCNSSTIYLYKKNIDGKYELSFKKDGLKDVSKVIGIKKNIIIIFTCTQHVRNPSFATYDRYVYKYDFDKDILIEIDHVFFSDRHLRGQFYINYLVFHNKYYLLKYGSRLSVLDITQDFENIVCSAVDETYIDELCCNYEGDIFIALDEQFNTRFFTYKNNTFTKYDIFPFTKKEVRNVLKLKNGYFITYGKTEINIVKKLD